MKYQVVYSIDEDGKTWLASVTNLQGCHTFAHPVPDSIACAREMVLEAIGACFEDCPDIDPADLEENYSNCTMCKRPLVVPCADLFCGKCATLKGEIQIGLDQEERGEVVEGPQAFAKLRKLHEKK